MMECVDDEYENHDEQSATVIEIGSVTKSPCSQEIPLLKDTNFQCHSSLAQLQASTLVKNVSISPIKRRTIDEFLETLCEKIKKLPVIRTHKLSHCQQMFADVKIPFLMKPKKVKGDMVFSPPRQVQVVGSYCLKTCLKKRLNIDLVLELPKECMQDKDFLNQRYLRKRAVYLTYVAHFAKSFEDVSNVMFSFFMENHQKPILLIESAGKLAKHITIRCHVCPADDSLKLNRFHPSKSNVRKSWFSGIDTEDSLLQPTPHYNSLILADMLMIHHQEYVTDVLSRHSEDIRDAIKLLKIWIKQRELDQGQGSFSGFLITMVVTYLLKLGKINRSMRNFQVVRNVLQFLATSNWMKNGISMCDNQDISEFFKHFDIVFIDPSGHLNLCFELSTPVYIQVQHEARLSIETLDNHKTINNFEIVFMNPVPFTRTFDHLLRINKFGTLRTLCQKPEYQDHLSEYNGNALSCAFSSITSCLERGLDSRSELISCRGCQYGCWEVTQVAPVWDSPKVSLTYGFLLTSKATQIVEKGPVAGAQEASSFREFWGDKAELRQFKDGGICEAVVWNCDNQMQRRKLPEMICKHLLSMHFSLTGNSLTYIGSQMETVLLHQQLSSQNLCHNGCYDTGDEIKIQLDRSYNELCNLLRSLKDLPLSIVSIFGISSALRHTEMPVCTAEDVFAKLSTGKNGRVRTTPPYISPIEIMCNLESSGKWPQDVDALRRVKASFLRKIADDLETSSRRLVCVPSQSFIDILKDGFVFRVTVSCQQELALTKRSKIVKSSSLSLKLEENTVQLPKLANSLRSISQGNLAFGLTCRLAKQWINAHMLSNHMPGIITDLLCAYLFISSQPYSEPKSSWVAFHRFLWLLSSFDFHANPIIVNFNDAIQAEDMKSIMDHFREHRETLPALYITTSLSPTTSLMSCNYISPVILNRLKVLAVVSLNKLNEICAGEKGIDFLPIFSSTASVYDAVIHLDQKYTANHHIDYQTEKSRKRKRQEMDISPTVADIGFNPAQYYLQDLARCHSDKALYFLNEDDTTKIGVLWKPLAFVDQDFKIGHCLNHDMVTKKRVRCDVNAVIEDFRILGDGLVKEIELHSARWTI